MKFLFALLIPFCLLTAGVAFGQGGIPDYPNIYVAQPNGSPALQALFVLPDGTGSSLTQAQIRGDGTVVDATIEVTLLDSFGVPVANYPREDVWLESADGGMIPCVGGTVADQNSDEFGWTIFQTPLLAGGSSEAMMYVMVAGLAVSEFPLLLAINSADMNGDGLVNLADVGMFSMDFFGDYAFRADFFADGVLNLADVGRLAAGLGASCP